MRRPLAALTAAAALALVPAQADAAVIVGLSDQQAGTFASPLFPQLKARTVRYIAPYDVMDDPAQLARMDAWINGARARRARPFIHFEHSRKSHAAGDRAPSVRAYTKAIRAFKKAYPDVREIGVWNEANRKRDRRRAVGQPTAGKPGLLVGYYKAALRVFKGPRYKVVALDILDENNVRPAVKLLKQFQSRLSAGQRRKVILGFHNYSDTNRFGMKRTAAVLKAFKGREVWLTETGGLVQFGKSFPYDERRAARAIGCTFKIAKTYSRQIKRVYIYNFNPPTNPQDVFDSGLIGKDGQPRPGFAAVKSRKVGRC